MDRGRIEARGTEEEAAMLCVSFTDAGQTWRGREEALAGQGRYARVWNRSHTCECTAPSSRSRCHGQVKEPLRHLGGEDFAST